MPYVQLMDARMSYETQGHAGSPVLLIMGFGVPGRFWSGQVPAIATRHKVAWFDNCGSGDTETTGWRPMTTAAQARHAVGVLDALKWPDAHIVGVSMGGMIAQEIALRHRSRVRSLSLVVSHAGGWRNVLPTAPGLLLFLAGFLGPRRRRARALEQLIYPPHYLAMLDSHEIRTTLEEQIATAGTRSDRIRQLLAVLGHSTKGRLHQLAGLPTLIVSADQDVLVRPAACRQLHQLIAGSRLVVYPKAGHGLLHQCATELNGELLQHFAEVDDAASATAAEQVDEVDAC